MLATETFLQELLKLYGLYTDLVCQNGWSIRISVTRSGDLLDFGQLFKAFGNNKFAQISHIPRQFL